MHQTQANPSQVTSKRCRRLAFTALVLQTALTALALEAQTVPPQITRIDAAGVDLELTLLRGSPAPAGGGLDVVISSPICGEVQRQQVATPTAEVTTMVPNVLGNVVPCGTQYTAVLEDLTGPVGMPLPFQVHVQCQNTSQCGYQLAPQIEVENALAYSPDLDQALTQAAGSADLVNTVSATHPQLRDEILSYAFHLDRLLAAQGSGWTNSCTCQWTGRMERSTAGNTDIIPAFRAHACPASPNNDFTWTTTFRFTHRCHTLSSGVATSLVLPGGQTLTVPAFESCSPLTAPTSATGLRLTLEGEAKAWGDLGLQAEATLGATFSFDDLELTSDSVAVLKSDLEDLPQSQSISLESGFIFATHATVSAHATAEVVAVDPGTFGESSIVGAKAESTLVIEAVYGVGLSWIRLWAPTRFSDDRDDSLDEGQDVVACEDSGQ